MTRRTICAALLFSTLVLGCAQLNEPDASVMTDAAPPSASGTATGFFESFDIVSSAAFVRRGGGLGVLVTSAEDLCTDFDRRIERPNTWALALFAEVSPMRVEIPPGVYELGVYTPTAEGEVVVDAFVQHSDANCVNIIPFSFGAGTGEVVFSEISGDRIRGSYDIYFGENRLVGEFDSPRCLPHGLTFDCER